MIILDWTQTTPCPAKEKNHYSRKIVLPHLYCLYSRNKWKLITFYETSPHHALIIQNVIILILNLCNLFLCKQCHIPRGSYISKNFCLLFTQPIVACLTNKVAWKVALVRVTTWDSWYLISNRNAWDECDIYCCLMWRCMLTSAT